MKRESLVNRESLTLRPAFALVAAIGLLLAGPAATWLLMRPDGNPPAPTSTAISPPAAPVGESRGEVVVPLTKEAATRAGIVVAAVRSGQDRGEDGGGSELRLPGIVQPNAYRQVIVTPLVSGRITHVSVALGDRVRRGQTIAVIDSPERADAERRYVAARAELDAHERELQRTEKLVTIGAASRQELDRVHAAHTAQRAEVASARARLDQLGVAEPEPTIGRATPIVAPADGVVIERQANVGVNVDPSSKLFTIVDLSTVWIVADLFERDFSRAQVGTEAIVTTTAYPDLAMKTTVSYVEPQVDPATRTAKVRLELPNPRGTWRLGMYVDVRIRFARAHEPSSSTIMAPRSAVQAIGARQVVYRVDSPDSERFIEREVRLGQAAGDNVEILSGLTAGDLIVIKGSFFLRAESDRLGLRPDQRHHHAPSSPP